VVVLRVTEGFSGAGGWVTDGIAIPVNRRALTSWVL
jgi:hypothetical protein